MSLIIIFSTGFSFAIGEILRRPSVVRDIEVFMVMNVFEFDWLITGLGEMDFLVDRLEQVLLMLILTALGEGCGDFYNLLTAFCFLTGVICVERSFLFDAYAPSCFASF